ncbi:hypothetical protein [Thiocapsa sp. UBA6158]|jgi:hypothetical protein|uniref:hypothetical protein n=1 Tax=Thiocapsa sp. UBA6158 TaxID=1947692 RepID=UPI0026015373|nr:hypothetical protein [Thiocapsa sp. UBA6158]
MSGVSVGCAERERGATHRILRHGRPVIAALSLAAIRLGHRGPNGSGVHCVDAFGLAHTRLSIIDLGGGHQPILDTDGHYASIPPRLFRRCQTKERSEMSRRDLSTDERRLFEDLCAGEFLAAGFPRARKSKGVPGIDGVTIAE